MTVNRLKTLFDDVGRESQISMLSTDTLYLVNYYDITTYKIAEQVWNNSNSCYYEGYLRSVNGKSRVEKIENRINASEELTALEPDFKKIGEKIDTLGYNNYVKTHDLPKNQVVQFTVAIKKGNHWKFVHSKAITTSSFD